MIEGRNGNFGGKEKYTAMDVCISAYMLDVETWNKQS